MDASRSIAPTGAPARAEPEPSGVGFHASPTPLSPEVLARVKDRRVLFLLAATGQVPQETVLPIDAFERSGVTVECATLDGGRVRFDPLSVALAWFEALWNPTLRLLTRARREKRFTNLPSLRAMAAAGQLDKWLGRFDAVVVPGGHGRVYAGFVRDPLIIDAVAGFYAEGRVVGLLCHGPLTAALPGRRGPGFVAGKTVTCWPRGVERILGAVPFVGAYLMPFGRPVGALLEEAGARVHDSALSRRRVHAAVDGRLVTGSGPWSAGTFVHAMLHVLATGRPAAGA